MKPIDVETMWKLQTAREKTKLKPSFWVTDEEANLIYNMALECRPECIFESGTAFGYSAMWLSLVGCPVFTFDPIQQKKHVWDELGYNQPENLTLVHDKFSSIVTMNRDFPGKAFFFIDGHHTPRAVGKDCLAVKQYAKDGDVVVFHDLCDRGPRYWWHKLILTNASSYDVYETPNIVGRLIWSSNEE